MQGQPVAVELKARDGADAVFAQQAFLPKLFAGGQVREVNFYHGRIDGRYGIGQGNAGVCVAAGVEHNAMVREAHFMQLIN